MVIGIPKETKKHEYRVGMTPEGVEGLKLGGHTVLIETGAGEGSGFADGQYLKAGADIGERQTVFSKADLLVKVKEPVPAEYDLLRDGCAIFTYLHLAPNQKLTEMLLKKRITALAYETLQKDNILPLLLPMSEVAGRMAPLVGAYYLQKPRGGTGVLPTGMAGVGPAKAVILGAGTVGFNAARVSAGLEMETVVINRGSGKLEKINEFFRGNVRTLLLSSGGIAEEIRNADIVIGAVLVPGGKTPVLITRQMLKSMKKGAVLVDVSVDQGGCAETSKPTTHDDPVYEVDGIIHYMVANMPGAYPRTSTIALTNATLPYVKEIAAKGIREAIQDPVIRSALNISEGKITHKELVQAFSS
jgi:alanine dehydrogenase